MDYVWRLIKERVKSAAKSKVFVMMVRFELFKKSKKKNHLKALYSLAITNYEFNWARKFQVVFQMLPTYHSPRQVFSKRQDRILIFK